MCAVCNGDAGTLLPGCYTLTAMFIGGKVLELSSLLPALLPVCLHSFFFACLANLWYSKMTVFYLFVLCSTLRRHFLAVINTYPLGTTISPFIILNLAGVGLKERILVEWKEAHENFFHILQVTRQSVTALPSSLQSRGVGSQPLICSWQLTGKHLLGLPVRETWAGHFLGLQYAPKQAARNEKRLQSRRRSRLRIDSRSKQVQGPWEPRSKSLKDPATSTQKFHVYKASLENSRKLGRCSLHTNYISILLVPGINMILTQPAFDLSKIQVGATWGGSCKSLQKWGQSWRL